MNSFYKSLVAGLALVAGSISPGYCADPAHVKQLYDRTTLHAMPGRESSLYCRIVTDDGREAEIRLTARKDDYQQSPLAITVRMHDQKMTLIDENLDGKVDFVLFGQMTFSDRQSLKSGQSAYDDLIDICYKHPEKMAEAKRK